MSPNQIFVRNLVQVVVAIAAVTTVALWLGRPTGQSPRRTQPTHRSAAPPRSLAELGARLFETKGCVACHSTDGSPRIGPTMKGAFGREVVLGDGVTLVFDEAYVRESLASPQAKARPGYPPSMPSFDGLLKDREIEALVEYLRTLH